MKRDFLVVYDYGTGGVWAIVNARSVDEIETKFRDLTVIDARPKFMTDEIYSDLKQTMTFDIDHPEGWITQLLRPDPTQISK